MALPQVTISGNLVKEVELRFTQNNKAFSTIRIGCSDRRKDQSGNWVDGSKLYITGICWENLAEESANLTKGDSVVVTGKLRTNEYEKDGAKVSNIELLVDSISKDIRSKSKSAQAPAEQDPWDSAGF